VAKTGAGISHSARRIETPRTWWQLRLLLTPQIVVSLDLDLDLVHLSTVIVLIIHIAIIRCSLVFGIIPAFLCLVVMVQ